MEYLVVTSGDAEVFPIANHRPEGAVAPKTDTPHWASWSPVGKLDFHTPEFFGTLKIG